MYLGSSILIVLCSEINHLQIRHNWHLFQSWWHYHLSVGVTNSHSEVRAGRLFFYFIVSTLTYHFLK